VKPGRVDAATRVTLMFLSRWFDWPSALVIVRPETSSGPGVPDPPASSTVPLSKSRHRLDDFRLVHAKPILGGLHHEYSLARA